MKISIVIPAYNEAENLAQLLSYLQEHYKEAEIIVVDDGSEDNTEQVLAAFKNIKVIKHEINKGNGAAVKSGLRNATNEIVCIIDADNQHNPEYISEMYEYMDKYDLVVGARTSGRGLNISRNFGNFLLNKIAGYLVNYKILDLTSGFRMFKKQKIMEFYHLYPEGFSFPTTSTMCMISAGYKVKFFKIKGEKRKAGKSKINLFKDGIKFFLIMVRIITLFNPLKFFIPAAIVQFLISFLILLYNVWRYTTGRLSVFLITSGTLLFFVSGLLTFFIGLLADLLSKIIFIQLKSRERDD